MASRTPSASDDVRSPGCIKAWIAARDAASTNSSPLPDQARAAVAVMLGRASAAVWSEWSESDSAFVFVADSCQVPWQRIRSGLWS